MELSPADIGEEDLREWCRLANWAAFEICGYRNTCIATSHALVAFLQARGLDAQPFRAEVHAHSPLRSVHGMALGWDGDGSRRRAARPGMWWGHLAVECAGYVLDPTIDQAEVGDTCIRPAVFAKPEGWDGGTAHVWQEAGLTVRHQRYHRQVGWKSAPDARPSHWRDIGDLMGMALAVDVA